jgi:alpha-1,2-mannosyltransferase
VTRTPERFALIVLAAVGASLLLVVAVNRWGTPSDEHAYWLAAQRLLAAQPLYDASALPGTPYAYWYPPIVAQVLTPIAFILSSEAFSALWTLLMLACLWWLADRNVLLALAMCAFPPIVVEFWFRNVHLLLAVMLVLALRRWPGWYSVGAGIDLSPALGIPYLALTGRRRDALVASAFGAVLLVSSVALAPDAWRQYVGIALSLAPGDAPGLIPVPYLARLVAGLAVTVVAARLEPRIGRPMLVVAVVVALPALWFAALSTLVAIVPLMREPRSEAMVGSG